MRVACLGLPSVARVPQNGVKNSVWVAAGWRILLREGPTTADTKSNEAANNKYIVINQSGVYYYYI